MIIEQAWAKRTNHEIVPFKSLMHRRRLVHSPGNGLEVMNAKGKGITAAIPADHIEWMMRIMNRVDPTLLFHPDKEIVFLVMRGQRPRPTNIPLAKRRVLQQLAVPAEVFFREPNGAARLQYK